MRALNRKLLRDLWHLKAQVLAIVVVMSCGVGTFVMSNSILQSLESIRDWYYREYAFADVFVNLKRIPDAMAGRIAAIPGVSQLHTRITTVVRVEIPGMIEPASGQLISLPAPGQLGLNRVFVRTGRLPEYGVASEVAVSEAFATAHQMQLGDALEVIINGHTLSLTVVGIALSPEYIYEIPVGGLLPDNRTFGVLWMDRQTLASAMDMTGAFNNITLTLTSPRDEASVIRDLDELTSGYGGLGAFSRADQQSHKFIQNELNELRNMSLVAPSIFLCVAAFLLNIVLARLIATQREQIAALKAFGYSNAEVAWHYLKMALVAAVLGSLAGTLLGIYLGRGMTQMYTKLFHFPKFEFELPLSVVVLGWMVSSSFAIMAVWASVRRAMRLPPAEAMRPEPPATYQRTWLENIGALLSRSLVARMVMRQIGRTPRRAALSMLGISLAVAVLILGSFMQDAVDYLFDAMFRLSQRYDVNVVFVDAKSVDAVNELAQLPGVLSCEGYRSVAARLRHGHHQRLVPIQGYVSQLDLLKLVDRQRHSIDVPTNGLMVSAELAKILEAAPGDLLSVEVLEGKRPSKQLALSTTIDDFAGTTAYLQHQELCDLLGESLAITGAFLAIDPAAESDVYRRLKEMPGVAKVLISRSTRDSFQRTVAENIRRIRLINLIFSCVISIGVVYSTARISLAERSRDLATMRVLGFTRHEVAWILFAELAALTAVAIPVGSAIGYGLAWLMIKAADPELFRLPLIVELDTYVFAGCIVTLATVMACFLMRHQIDRLELVEVLKSRE